MLPVWTAIKVTKEDHPRANQAGTVYATNAAEHPDDVVVKFDDNTIESVQIADLIAL